MTTRGAFGLLQARGRRFEPCCAHHGCVRGPRPRHETSDDLREVILAGPKTSTRARAARTAWSWRSRSGGTRGRVPAGVNCSSVIWSSRGLRTHSGAVRLLHQQAHRTAHRPRQGWVLSTRRRSIRSTPNLDGAVIDAPPSLSNNTELQLFLAKLLGGSLAGGGMACSDDRLHVRSAELAGGLEARPRLAPVSSAILVMVVVLLRSGASMSVGGRFAAVRRGSRSARRRRRRRGGRA